MPTPSSSLQVAWQPPTASEAATHRSRSPPARSDLASRPERQALTAWMPGRERLWRRSSALTQYRSHCLQASRYSCARCKAVVSALELTPEMMVAPACGSVSPPPSCHSSRLASWADAPGFRCQALHLYSLGSHPTALADLPGPLGLTLQAAAPTGLPSPPGLTVAIQWLY